MIAVSVIVPVYNTEKYLAKCLESLVSQTLEEMEILLIDDGSTDGSYKIMEQFRCRYPEKIRIFQKENGGQGAARNLGISLAEGEYIGFVDSDDYVAPQMYGEMYRKAAAEKLDLVQCRFHYRTGEGKELSTYGTVKKYSSRKEMFIDPLVSPWNKLIKASLLKDNAVTFTEGYIYEDTAFYLKLIPFVEKSGLIEESFVFHIERGDSTMNASKGRRVAHIFPVLEDALDYYEERDFAEQYREELEYFCVKILLCSSLQRIAGIADKGLRKRTVSETFGMTGRRFPAYKENRYFRHGRTGLYIRWANRYTVHFYILIFRIQKWLR